jgi:alpha-glucosidase
MYYGDEIGMHNVEVPPECEQDPQGIRIGRKRDPVRTPMQWNANQGADFTRGNPWLPLARDFKEVNVNAQDGHSLLALYRRLLSLRCTRRALITGHYKSAFTTEHFLAYHRSSETENFLIILNFSDRPQSIDVNDFSDSARLLASTWMDRDESNVQDMLECRGNEGIIIQL